MNMIFLLIGFSIVLALVFLLAFFWASRTGQNDDLYTPGVRILFDDELMQEHQPEEEIHRKDDEDHKSC